mgnify:CR=1 FL=1
MEVVIADDGSEEVCEIDKKYPWPVKVIHLPRKDHALNPCVPLNRAVAETCTSARVTTLLLPGIGTLEDLERAEDLGVRSVRVATHCTEADVAQQHIAAARKMGLDVSGFLMMSHMAPPQELAA